MARRLTKANKQTTKAEGLTLKELEAQAGNLLPDRVEMRRRRRRGGGCFTLLLGCGSSIDIL